ncbi:MAG: DUF6350 family protein [Microbacterium sp.]
MNRLLVAILAAVDAVIAAAVGVAVVLAPLTVFWVLGLGSGADWAALWPASARIWQFGQLVPVLITLPPEYLTAAGIPTDAATFWLSLTPLALAGFTAVFAARSGARAAQAGEWIVGVASGSSVTAVIAWILWRTSQNPVAAVYGWQALGLPTAVFAVPALIGALVGAWRDGDDGPVDAVRAALERRGGGGVVEASVRGGGIAVAGFIGIGAALVAVATVMRAGEVIALFEAAHADAVGTVVIALGQLAYLPTLVVWGGAFAAGPGFGLGTGASVSPAGTTVGVLPGIPALGIVPEETSHWMLLCVLLFVAVGFVAGAAARRRLLTAGAAGAAGSPAGGEASGPRAAALAAIVVLGAGAAALLAVAASGGIGPDRLAQVGPAPGPVAFTYGGELLVGAAIALFTPLRARRDRAREDGVLGGDGVRGGDMRGGAGRDVAFGGTARTGEPAEEDLAPPAALARGTAEGLSEDLSADDVETEPFAPGDLDPLHTLGEPDDTGAADTPDERH